MNEKTVSVKAQGCTITITDPHSYAQPPVLIMQPARVILDVHFLAARKSSSLSSACIAKVRFGTHDSFTRIVFDLVEQEASMRLSKDGSTTTIELIKNNSTPEAAPTQSSENKREESIILNGQQGILDYKKKTEAPTLSTPTLTPRPTITATPTQALSPTKTPTLIPTAVTLTPTQKAELTITSSTFSTQISIPTPAETPLSTATPSALPSSTFSPTPTATLTPTKSTLSGDISLLTLVDFSVESPKGVKFTFNKPTDFRILKASPILLKIIVDRSKSEGPHVLKPYFAPSTLPAIESVQVQEPQEERIVILITLERNIDVNVYRSGNSIIAEPK